jgi:hypothetical protein
MLDELRPFLGDISRGHFRRALTENRIFGALSAWRISANRRSVSATTCPRN